MLHLSRRRYDILSDEDVRNAAEEEMEFNMKYFNKSEIQERHDEILRLYEIERKINKLLLTKDERIFFHNKQILEDFDDQLNIITDPGLDILDDERDELVDATLKSWFNEYPFLKNRKYCMNLERSKDEETHLFEVYGITYSKILEDPNIFEILKNKANKRIKMSNAGKRKEKPNKSKEKDSNYFQKAAGI